MKLVKKLIPMILSLILVLAMLPTGARATVVTGSLTIKDTSGNVKTTSAYSAYQIVTWDASTDTATGKPVFTNMKLNATYKSAIVAAVSGLTAASTDAQILTAISGLDAAGTAALAVALKAVATTATYTATSGVFSGMVYGYYLVIETANAANDGSVISKPILVCIPDSTSGSSSVVVNVKTSTATIQKKIVESVGLVDSSTAAVGDTINYQSLSTFPTYSSDSTGITYYITDTFSAGLTFVPASVVVKVVGPDGTTAVKTLVSGTDYTLANSGQTFSVTLKTDADIKAWGNAGDKLLVTYSATLNSTASYGSTGNPNSVNLTYSNKPGTGGTSYTTPDDTVITYTTKLVITKKDSTGTALTGATFELYKNSLDNGSGTWTKIDTQTTAGTGGTATFTTLEQGAYKLIETVAPTGFNLLADPILFTVSATNSTTSIPNTGITVTQSGNTAAAAGFKATWAGTNGATTDANGLLNLGITDTKGFTLPGTGGIGTTIFTVSGIAILLLGICLVLVYFKKRKEATDR